MTQISSKPINVNPEDIEKGKKLFAPRPAANTMSLPTFTDFSKEKPEKPDRQPDYYTPKPTRTKASPGGRTLCSSTWRTRRNTFLARDGLCRTQEEEREGTADQASRVIIIIKVKSFGRTKSKDDF